MNNRQAEGSLSSVYSTIYNVIRFSAAIATVLILVFERYIPDTEVSLAQDSIGAHSIYSETAANGHAKLAWVDQAKRIWVCDHKPTPVISCGYSLTMEPIDQLGMDLSDYKGIKLQLKYDGPSRHIRFFARNYHPNYSNEQDFNSTKFMTVLLDAKELNDDGIYIELSELAVAEWWVMQYQVSRPDARPDFTSLRTIGLDFMEPGHHTIQIIDAIAVRDWVSKEVLYSVILLIWMLIILAEGLNRFLALRKQAKENEQRITDLVSTNTQLVTEHHKLSDRAQTDPLTGIYNRAGLEAQLNKIQLKGTSNNPLPLGVLLLDLDHFKNINDTYGHQIGDEVLQAFTDLVTTCIRDTDIFARWGGEEFVLIVPDIHSVQLSLFGEKIRTTVATTLATKEVANSITVSIGGAIGNSHTPFEELLKKADTALYNAKRTGRNKLVVTH